MESAALIRLLEISISPSTTTIISPRARQLNPTPLSLDLGIEELVHQHPADKKQHSSSHQQPPSNLTKNNITQCKQLILEQDTQEDYIE
jgi:hypothetical protein